MKTLIIYDTTGRVFSQQTQEVIIEPVGIPFLVVELGYREYVDGVDMSKDIHAPIIKQYPKSELELLREELVLTKEMATVAVEAIASMNEEVIL